MSFLDRVRAVFTSEPNPACPACGSEAVVAVTVPGVGGPFDSPINVDGPAWGCTGCQHKWGRWGDEFADGRV